MIDPRAVLQYLAETTALEMRYLFPSGDGYVGRMSRWTGRYSRVAAPVRSDEAGMLAGRLWLLHMVTGDRALYDIASRLTDSFAGLVGENETLVDASWDLYFGVALGAELTGSRAWAEKALIGARRHDAKGWSPEAGAFVFTVGDERLIPFEGVASMILTAWAGGAAPELLARYTAHLDRLLALGLVREDGSSHHLAMLDEAYRLERLDTYQGYSADSTWARGQAWGMMGYLAAYEATGIQRYLDTVVRMTDWWLGRTSGDPVPYYDFDDPRGEILPRDSCAAAIVANVLLKLHRLTSDARYLQAADVTITELHNNYLGRGGCLLHASGGTFHTEMFGSTRNRRPPKTPADWSLARRFPQEEVLHYGDYFFVEALHRRSHDDWSLFDLPSKTLSGRSDV